MGDAERKMEEADIVEWIDDDGRTRTDGRTDGRTDYTCAVHSRGKRANWCEGGRLCRDREHRRQWKTITEIEGDCICRIGTEINKRTMGYSHTLSQGRMDFLNREHHAPEAHRAQLEGQGRCEVGWKNLY